MADPYVLVPMTLSDLNRRDTTVNFFFRRISNNSRTVWPRTTNSGW